MTTVRIVENTGPILEQIRSVRDDVRNKAVSRTLNDVAALGKTQVVAAIRKTYNIKAGDARDRVTIERANSGALTSAIRVASLHGRRAANLIIFGARQLKRGGVSVKIRKDKGTVRGEKWWIMKGKSGGEFVAQRVGRGRNSIKGVMTIDVGQMFNSFEINIPLQKLIRDRFPDVFARNAAFYTSRVR